jgi:small subunit ribosomal protein S4
MMGRDRDPAGKRSRNLGVNVAETPKIDALMKKRPYASGQHGQARKKVSEFGKQLKAKQTVKAIYGVREKQLRNYYETASRKKGNTGTLLLQQLECRVDNLLYKAGFAITRRQARQLVVHGHCLLNGRKHDVPSTVCRPGDMITVRAKSMDLMKGLHAVKTAQMESGSLEWLHVDVNTVTTRLVRHPERSEIDATLQEPLIIEFYSR